ncbi:MAG: hypothetical protein MK171_07285 [Pirellulales bacterium]|nr:hypothetical protein [Pirellulales bacterium]
MYRPDRFSYRIRCANFDETGVENVVDPRRLRVGSVDGHIFWGEFGTERLRRDNLEGTAVVDLSDARPLCSAMYLSAWLPDLSRIVHRRN